MELNYRALISKLNRTCHRALEGAAGLCVSRSHYNLELEHWLFKLNDESNGDFAKILRWFEGNPDRVAAGLTKALDRMKTGASRAAPAFSPAVMDAIRGAWMVCSLDLGLDKVRSGGLLLALLQESQTAAILREASAEFAKVSTAELKSKFREIVAGSSEDAEAAATATGAASADGAGAVKGDSKTPSLDQFTINLTALARQGKIDPVLGRDREIRQLVDILTRRRQNNPILTGEAGVGKTAVVEGFALRIAAGDVPPPLQPVILRTLDLGLLQAGAGVKGEFENRLKTVIEEVKSSPAPIILFIDEAHTLIGAGGAAGQGDAANLLKPALARGDLRTIAATTWAEYKKYFEKDAALARRFQVVKVDEPSEAAAINMMRGITGMLEKHHGVPILDSAVEASVHLSARYLSGRQLPDKSVSLLDTACARVAIGQSTIPPALEDLTRRISHAETEERVLIGEEAGGANHADRLTVIRAGVAKDRESLAELEKRWTAEKERVVKLRDLRAKVRALAAGDGKGSPEALKLRDELETLSKELSKLQGESPLLQVCVDDQTIGQVISGWTGIPIGRMMTDEIQTVLKLRELLAARVVGQSNALDAIARRIQTSRANLDDPRKPVGVFLLVGSSGVGKTETAVALADLLYGGERNLITINMSEYQEAHTVSSLKGSPPGYVGYGEGGVLTEAVRRKPYSVVLLDEVEKAHPDVMELFFQVFDKGMLEDGEGRPIDFKNTVILLTSNVATESIVRLTADPDTRPDAETLTKAIRPELEKVFPPALLGRLVICPYYPLEKEILRAIVRLKLDKIVRRVRENQSLQLEYDDAVAELVVDRCRETASGARAIDNLLTHTLLPELSQELLTRLAEGAPARKARVAVDPSGAFTYNLS